MVLIVGALEGSKEENHLSQSGGPRRRDSYPRQLLISFDISRKWTNWKRVNVDFIGLK